MRLQSVVQRLPEAGPERRAIQAGEIDAIIDYASSNVILLPAARRAFLGTANLPPVSGREAAGEAALGNGMLAALPESEYRRLIVHFELLKLESGEILQEPDYPIHYVYFPIDCVACLMSTVKAGQSVEVGLIGYEGMAGISCALGVDVASVRAVIQASGTALRMKAARFREILGRCPTLQRELHRYAHTKLVLARRTVACGRFHSIEARLACWLLMTGDRVRSEEFFLTQAFLAGVLGVRRATINEAAGPLRRRKLIGYSRGRIRILDRRGLESVSCGCYARIGYAIGRNSDAHPRPQRKPAARLSA